MDTPYTDIDKLYIDGGWEAAGGEPQAVLNPATETVIGHAPVGDAGAAEAPPGPTDSTSAAGA